LGFGRWKIQAVGLWALVFSKHNYKKLKTKGLKTKSFFGSDPLLIFTGDVINAESIFLIAVIRKDVVWKMRFCIKNKTIVVKIQKYISQNIAIIKINYYCCYCKNQFYKNKSVC